MPYIVTVLDRSNMVVVKYEAEDIDDALDLAREALEFSWYSNVEIEEVDDE